MNNNLPSLTKELAVAVWAAKAAGKIIMAKYGKAAVNYKEHMEIVTEADKQAEKKIIAIIKKAFPAHSIIAEESGKSIQKSKFTWVIDPLDGTGNFTMMLPFFNTSIALMIGNTPVLGVVYSPIQKELFHAIKGKGAFLNGRQIKVSKQDNLLKSRTAFCHGGKTPELIKRSTDRYVRLKLSQCKVRQLGSAALELAYVAAGRLGAFWMTNINLWDVAAGVLLVQEAGGIVTDFEKKQFTGASRDIIASNPGIYHDLLPLLQE